MAFCPKAPSPRRLSVRQPDYPISAATTSVLKRASSVSIPISSTLGPSHRKHFLLGSGSVTQRQREPIAARREFC
jgi:hypothetical protein